MIKKPAFTVSKEKRLSKAKKELEREDTSTSHIEKKQTTVILEANLLYAAKEVALKRKKLGIEPNTLTGMIRKALKDIVDKELNI